ncbi:HD domain-containing protein [Povalibacter sp.]|uniref:HD domain-containing protein n=1 Tax=Povalibacter sp. TaxID=1962978 RepID=UPI002F407A49
MSVSSQKRFAYPVALGSLIALIATVGIETTAWSAEAAKPTIESTGDWRADVLRFAQVNLKHPAWGASHSVRDYELARELAAADGVTLDDDVLYAAAYLHDVAAFAPFSKAGVDHQDEAASIVESMLAGTGFPMSKIEAVRGSIRTHMYGRDPTGPEAIYLHDADALDWLGAIGVARVFGLVDPNGGAPDGPTVVKRLESNLAQVPARIVSKAGKARAPQRVRELEEFLRDLRSESADFRSL